MIVSVIPRQYKRGDSLESREMPDYAAQRANMVQAQLATNAVTDPRILAVMGEVPRERFVPAAQRVICYSDLPVEVSPGRYLLDPRSFAKLLMLAEMRESDHVLDVGCTSGYSSTVLGRLAKSVVALEQDGELVRLASELLPAIGAGNVTVIQGALSEGAKDQAPFDVILINGAIEDQPKTLFSQLGEGGRLVAVMQQSPLGRAALFVREKGQIGVRAGFDAAVPLLKGFRKTVGFVF